MELLVLCHLCMLVVCISDVELTCVKFVNGFLETLEGKGAVSIMADRGFTVKDQLSQVSVNLNIPPFLGGRAQLPSAEVKKGKEIAFLRFNTC